MCDDLMSNFDIGSERGLDRSKLRYHHNEKWSTMFGDSISGGANSIGAEQKVESSSEMSFFLEKSEKNHFLNYRDTKKII